MAIPQWVSGTRLYPLVPPLPVLLESVTSGPPPFRGKPECIPRRVDDGKPDGVPIVTVVGGGVSRVARQEIDDDDAVLAHADRERLDREVGRERQGAARLDVEASTVPRAHGDPFVTVEIALAQRAVVVGASILEREQVAAAVVDADREQGVGSDDPHGARRKLVERADLDLGHP